MRQRFQGTECRLRSKEGGGRYETIDFAAGGCDCRRYVRATGLRPVNTLYVATKVQQSPWCWCWYGRGLVLAEQRPAGCLFGVSAEWVRFLPYSPTTTLSGSGVVPEFVDVNGNEMVANQIQVSLNIGESPSG